MLLYLCLGRERECKIHWSSTCCNLFTILSTERKQSSSKARFEVETELGEEAEIEEEAEGERRSISDEYISGRAAYTSRKRFTTLASSRVTKFFTSFTDICKGTSNILPLRNR